VSAATTRHAAELFRRVWTAGTGRALRRASELQTALAISRHETGLGHGWGGEMAGSNNFGAVQYGGPGSTYVSVEHGDTHNDGSSYTSGFRYYVDAAGRTAEENGAIDFLRQISAPRRPLVADAIASGASLLRVAEAMRQKPIYFEGVGANPEISYAKALERNLLDIARDIGERPAVSYSKGAGNDILLWVVAALCASLAFADTDFLREP
jgi:hypothetical protein